MACTAYEGAAAILHLAASQPLRRARVRVRKPTAGKPDVKAWCKSVARRWRAEHVCAQRYLRMCKLRADVADILLFCEQQGFTEFAAVRTSTVQPCVVRADALAVASSEAAAGCFRVLWHISAMDDKLRREFYIRAEEDRRSV
jgi:hypothetical protein